MVLIFIKAKAYQELKTGVKSTKVMWLKIEFYKMLLHIRSTVHKVMTIYSYVTDFFNSWVSYVDIMIVENSQWL